MKDIFIPSIRLKILSRKQLEKLSILFYRIIVLHGFRHKENHLFSNHDNPILCLPSTYMRELFRLERKGGSYKDVIDTYFDCIDQSYSFGNGYRSTKKYRLKP